MYKEIEGDLIRLALNKKFDVIAHGCNCFCTMDAGIAKAMKINFGTHIFSLEQLGKGDINKLGQIDFLRFEIKNGIAISNGLSNELIVVNCYTQYLYGSNKCHLDYEALTLCMRKMNMLFKGKHIGLPKIGAGLAGGDWIKIKEIIQNELIDCNVTVIIYNK